MSKSEKEANASQISKAGSTKKQVKKNAVIFDSMRTSGQTACSRSFHDPEAIWMALEGMVFRHALYPFFKVKDDTAHEPTIKNHIKLLKVLRLNEKSSDTSVHSIEKDLEGLLVDISVLPKNQTLERIEDFFQKIITNIQKYCECLEVLFDKKKIEQRIYSRVNYKDYLEDKFLMKAFEQYCTNPNIPFDRDKFEQILINISTDYKDSSEADLQKLVETAFEEFLTILKEEAESVLAKDLAFHIQFSQDIFKKASILRKEINNWKIGNLDELEKKYSAIENNPKSTQNDLKQKYNVVELNVVTANFFIEIKYKDEANTEKDKKEWIEIYDDEVPVFSFRDLDENEKDFVKEQMTNAINRLKEHSNPNVVDPEENHSEKALVGYLLRKIEALIDKLALKLKENQEIKCIIGLCSVGIQVFSTRDYCNSCECLLSQSFSELVRTAFRRLKTHFTEIKQDWGPNTDLSKFCCYKLDLNPKKERDPNGNTRGKFYIDNNIRSLFDYKYLKSVLTEPYNKSAKWTYFISTPSGAFGSEAKELILGIHKLMKQMENSDSLQHIGLVECPKEI